MPDPIGWLFLSELLKKLIGIFGDQSKEKLFTQRAKRDPRLPQLVQIHTELKVLEVVLSDLSTLLVELSQRPDDEYPPEGVLLSILERAHKSLVALDSNLMKLAPGLEIMAEDLVPEISYFCQEDALVIARLGLLRNRNHAVRGEMEPLDEYRARLHTLRSSAEKARASLRAFIRGAYAWSDFRDLK
jgi:hypothetical protein